MANDRIWQVFAVEAAGGSNSLAAGRFASSRREVLTSRSPRLDALVGVPTIRLLGSVLSDGEDPKMGRTRLHVSGGSMH
jgi:hypothetical protein